MLRVGFLVAVGVSICAMCNGQSLPTETVFPSDSQDSKLARGAELLEAVCPGNVVVGNAITCHGACPDFTVFRDEQMQWWVDRVTLGHFVSATSEDAALSTAGCEPHSTATWGGTILLTRRSGRWTMLWYKGGVDTDRCHKAQLSDSREILVCIGSYGGQGNVKTLLFVEDMLAPVATLMTGEGHFFEAIDDVIGCGWNASDESKPDPVTRTNIEKIEFVRDSQGRSVVSVSGQTGERRMTADEAKKCWESTNPMAFAPPTKPYHLDFVFDGKDYKPAQ